jgi:hypothetical protein
MHLEIVKELTGGRRNHVFAYDRICDSQRRHGAAMKTNGLPAWATSMIQRISDVSRLDTAIAANLKGLGYGR